MTTQCAGNPKVQRDEPGKQELENLLLENTNFSMCLICISYEACTSSQATCTSYRAIAGSWLAIWWAECIRLESIPPESISLESILLECTDDTLLAAAHFLTLTPMLTLHFNVHANRLMQGYQCKVSHLKLLMQSYQCKASKAKSSFASSPMPPMQNSPMHTDQNL